MLDLLFIFIAVIAGFAVGLAFKANDGVKHQHIWRAVSSMHRNTFPYGSVEGGGDRPTRRATRILKVCFCGENRVDEIEGNWEFEDLTSHTI